jgi:hypothetical protein
MWGEESAPKRRKKSDAPNIASISEKRRRAKIKDSES